jgi:hypothetical protein
MPSTMTNSLKDEMEIKLIRGLAADSRFVKTSEA